MALSLFQRRENPELVRLRTELDAERARANQAEQAGLEIAKLMLERARITEPIVGPPNPLLPPPPGINLYAFDQPIRYSTPQPPTRRPQSLITTDTMRQIAATHDIIAACVAPETLVFCKRGLVPIFEIEAGDEVLTHLGRWRRVSKCLVNPVYEKVYSVRARSLDPLIATGNHPVYAARYRQTQTRKSRLEEIQWRRVDDLLAPLPHSMKPRDAATMPLIDFCEESILDLASVMGPRWINRDGMLKRYQGRSTAVPAAVPIDGSLGRLLGWYLAEGSQGNGRAVIFCLGPDEYGAARQILSDAYEVFGLRGTIKSAQAGAGFRVIIHSRILGSLFDCGTAKTKKLPEWAWSGTREFFSELLEAWAEGDGHIATRSGASRCVVRTSSQSLAWQMRLIAGSLGYLPSIATCHKVRDKLPVIRGQEIHADPLSYNVGWQIVPSIIPNSRFEPIANVIAHPIQSVEAVEYSDLVYNLEVEEDESFVTTGGIVHNCIFHLKREVDNVPLKVISKDPDDESPSTKKAIAAASAFMDTEGGMGGQGRRRSQFEQAWIQDLLVIGAAAFNFPITRGGKPFAMLAIDAATIRPRVDAYGWPGPTDHVYEQWIYGVQVAAFTRQELRYDGINALSYSPYFTSPVEMLLMPATTFIAEDEWNRRWLTDGTSPSEAWELPDTWTPEQVKAYAEWFTTLMAGNSRERQQVKFVPGKVMSSASMARKEHDFQALEEWLLHRTCSIFGVQPSSIGYPGHQYKVSQEHSFDQTSNFGVGQLLGFRKANYDDLLRRLGYDDLETQNVVEQEEKAGDRTARLVQAVGAPYMTINQAKKIEGQEPVEGGDCILVPNNMTTLDLVVNPPAPEEGDATMAPAGDQGVKSVEARKPAGGGNGKKPGPDAEEQARALALWRKKALARLKERGRATCAFEAPFIPREVHLRISRGLAECVDSDDVRRVFEEALLPLPETAPRGHVAPAYLVSHAHTIYTAGVDADDRITGWLDPPLTTEGRMEAREFGAKLRGLSIERIIASDLLRASQTAAGISSAVAGMPRVERTENLRPWNLGDLQGQPTEATMPALLDLIRDTPDAPAPGGEAWNTFKARLLGYVSECLSDQARGESGPLLLVTHSRCVELVRAWALAAAQGDLHEDAHFLLDSVPRGCVLMLSYGPTGWVSSAWEPGYHAAMPPARAERLEGISTPKERIGVKWRGRAEAHEAMFGKPAGEGGA